LKVSNGKLNVALFEEVCGEFDYTQVITSVFIGLNHHRSTPIHRVTVLPGEEFKGIIYCEDDSSEID